MSVLKEFVTNIIMNNKVFIILALLLICCLAFVNMSRSENKEYFNYNVVNKNPNEHQQSENISREVDELNKKIDSLENTTTNLDDKELENVTTEKDKKDEKDVDLEKPKTKSIHQKGCLTLNKKLIHL